MGTGKGPMDKPGRADALTICHLIHERGVKPEEETAPISKAEARKGKGPKWAERGAEGA